MRPPPNRVTLRQMLPQFGPGKVSETGHAITVLHGTFLHGCFLMPQDPCFVRCTRPLICPAACLRASHLQHVPLCRLIPDMSLLTDDACDPFAGCYRRQGRAAGDGAAARHRPEGRRGEAVAAAGRAADRASLAAGAVVCSDGQDWSTSTERRASSTWSWPLIRAAGTISCSRRSFLSADV